MKNLILATTSTGTAQFTLPSGVAFLTASDGSSQAVVSLVAQGAIVQLIALSSLYIKAINTALQPGTTATPNTMFQFSTST